ncbi:MAG: FitA-like ribbon-helix-helix domain-containing protein [Thiohalospira sp.]
MATLTIWDLDDELEERLSEEAARHGHSVEEEARQLLRQAVVHGPKRGGLGSRIHARFAAVGGCELTVPERRDLPRSAELPE